MRIHTKANFRHLPKSLQPVTAGEIAPAIHHRPENHYYALALYFVFYNFVKMHKSIRMTPAMAAGVTDKLWSMEDVVALIDANAPKHGPRGPYKKKSSN
jgi:hypothetical protein